METPRRRLYVGIDVHSREHRVAVIPIDVLEDTNANWRKTKVLVVRNNIDDFERLDVAIKQHINRPEEVAIAVDHTGGHYSAPIVYFLQEKGYGVYHLEAKAIKAVKERLLDEENKSDEIDATSAAYLLYLRDVHGLSFRVTAITPALGSRAALLNSLVIHRWQLTKLVTQTTNRLHQVLLAVFPEGEAKYFKQLLEIIPYYETPEDMLNSSNLEKVEGLNTKNRGEILHLASQTVGVPAGSYR